MKQKMKYVFFIMLLLFSLLAAEEYEQKTARSFNLPASGTIELANINGEIVITSSNGQDVEIKAVKKSDYKDEIENVEIIFETVNDTLKVYTKYNRKNIRAKVDFNAVIPTKLSRATFKSVNGAIGCKGKFQDLKLETVNGKIKLAGDFSTSCLSTVNGAVDISQEAQLKGDLSVETVNGAIDIEINRKSAFTIESQTVNGGIDCEFPISVQRHFVGSSLSGQVNGGGHKIKLETVNGRINISKI